MLNVRGNARLSVPGPLAQTTRYVLLEQEDWFEEEIRFVRRWLRNGMRAIDVGAAFGVYTVAIAQAVGGEGRVWAFEPTPDSAKFLAQNIALNGLRGVEVIRAAVSDRSGEVAFALYPNAEDNEIVPARSGAALSVPATTLDDAARDYGWADIDFLKLDVEGHEVEAIRGGEDFLRRGSPLVMFEIKKRGQLDLGALEPLAALGYHFYRLLPGPQVLAPFDHAQPVDPYQINLFACKADRASQLAAEGFLVVADEAGTPQRGAWEEYARSMPYARELSARWRSGPGFFSGSEDKAYWQGLAAFASSRSASLSAGQRCNLLDQALESVGEAVASGGTSARRLSYARLAWELGLRGLAAETLFGLLEETDADLGEPFLCPGARYDRLPVDGRPRDWLRCAVIEQYEKLRAYSSLFLPHDDSPSVLAAICELPFRSAEMDRRCQVVRMRTGQQARPQPGPLLCRRTEDNLNPDFWCGS